MNNTTKLLSICNRLATCAQEVYDLLGLSKSSAKELCFSVVNGATIPQEFENNETMKQLNLEGILLRWVAVALNPLLHAQCVEEGRRHPSASVLYYTWTMAEDFILEAWTKFIAMHPIRHLSLHFDGVMVDAARVGNQEVFKKSCEDAIHQATGYIVSIALKKHVAFLDLIADECQGKSEGSQNIPVDLLRCGDCILVALASFKASSKTSSKKPRRKMRTITKLRKRVSGPTGLAPRA